MTKITTFLQDFAADESGASAAEYALILAIVGAGIAGAAFALGTEITNAIAGVTDILKDPKTDPDA